LRARDQAQIKVQSFRIRNRCSRFQWSWDRWPSAASRRIWSGQVH